MLYSLQFIYNLSIDKYTIIWYNIYNIIFLLVLFFITIYCIQYNIYQLNCQVIKIYKTT